MRTTILRSSSRSPPSPSLSAEAVPDPGDADLIMTSTVIILSIHHKDPAGCSSILPSAELDPGARPRRRRRRRCC